MKPSRSILPLVPGLACRYCRIEYAASPTRSWLLPERVIGAADAAAGDRVVATAAEAVAERKARRFRDMGWRQCSTGAPRRPSALGLGPWAFVDGLRHS